MQSAKRGEKTVHKKPATIKNNQMNWTAKKSIWTEKTLDEIIWSIYASILVLYASLALSVRLFVLLFICLSFLLILLAHAIRNETHKNDKCDPVLVRKILKQAALNESKQSHSKWAQSSKKRTNWQNLNQNDTVPCVTSANWRRAENGFSTVPISMNENTI